MSTLTAAVSGNANNASSSLSSSLMMNGDDEEDEWCANFTTGYIEEKFWPIFVFGCSMSVVSMVNNLFLFAILVSNKEQRQSHAFFLIWIAVFDVLIAVLFVLIIGALIAFQKYEVLWLYHMWFSYVRYLFTLIHVVMVTSGYLIVAATLEKYFRLCPDWDRTYKFLTEHRFLSCCMAVVMALITRATVYLEIHVVRFDDCTGFAEYTMDQTALVKESPYYRKYFMFGLRGLLSILLPFIILAFCNAAIVIKLRNQNRRANFAHLTAVNDSTANGVEASDPSSHAGGRFSITSIRPHGGQTKSQTEAIRGLLLVVTSWLLANILNIVIILWEFVDIGSLRRTGVFYAISADLSSVMVITAGTLRLPIYYFSSSPIRQLIRRRLCCEQPKSKEAPPPEVPSPNGTQVGARSYPGTLYQSVALVEPSGTEVNWSKHPLDCQKEVLL